MKPPARIALAVMRVLYFLLLRWTVTGREHVPGHGALIVIANHVHVADPVLLMLAFPRHITFLAKEELFRYPFLGRLMRDGGMFPIARTGPLERKRDVVRQATGLLARGEVLALFPEGRRSHSGVLLEGKPGAAVLALRAGAKLVPVAIEGTEKLKGALWWMKRPRVAVTIGVPFSIHSAEGRLSRSESARLTSELMHSIARLLPEERRGPYGG